MPLFYSTSAPTLYSKNSITRTASGSNNGYGIRDYLLHRNIQNPIRYPQLSTSVNGSPRGGEPFLDTMVGSGVVIQQDPLTVSGVFRYENAVIMNLFKNQDPLAPRFIDIENVLQISPDYPVPAPGINQYPTVADSYIDEYGIKAISEYKEWRKISTLRNIYVDAPKQVDMADYISLQPVQTNQQLPSYDQAYGQLTAGGLDITGAANVLGSLLNGQGVGIGGNVLNGDIKSLNLVPNFDIRASLAGRVLGITGNLNDTKLGTVGAQQLALALANNAAFNTEQLILGKINSQQNVNAIFGSGKFEFPRPNYKITVSDDTLGKAVGTAERILGFTLPKSRLDDSGSIFFTESGVISNIERANSMLGNTGKGQRKALFDQVDANLKGISKYDNPDDSPFRSGYAPRYEKRGSGGFPINGKKPNLYAFNDSPSGDASGAKSGVVKNFLQPVTKEEPINEMNWNREKLVSDSGFAGAPNSSNPAPFAKNFAWTSSKGATTNVLQGGQVELIDAAFPDTDNPQIVGEKKSLLSKTQKLFNSKGMMTMVSAYGSAEGGNNKEQTQTAVSPNGFISKGSGVLAKGRFNPDGTLGNSTANDSAASTFCRTWIPQNRYDKVNKLIRSRGLNQKEDSGGQILTGSTKGWRLHNSELMSVLDDNGFVKIAPYKTDNLTRQATLPKKYMFSIENLAWVGSPAVNLLPIEQGPGDLLTGKFGRIMWFPPYDLTFSEASSVSLESSLFIGRGEPIYTYNNTERTGNLSFKVIVDHPSAMNAFKGNGGPTDEYIRSWFAGCLDDDLFTSKLTQEEKSQIKTIKKLKPVPDKVIPKKEAPSGIDIYFQNDITVINTLYENGDGTGLGPYVGEPQFRNESQVKNDTPEPGDTWPDSTDYGLNIPGKCSLLNNRKQKVGTKEFDSWSDPAYIAELTRYLKDDCPSCRAECLGFASQQGQTFSNERLALARAEEMKKWLKDNSILNDDRIVSKVTSKEREGITQGRYAAGTPVDQEGPKRDRYGKIKFINDAEDIREPQPPLEVEEEVQISLNQQVKNRFYTEQDFFEKLQRDDYFVFDKLREQIRYFHPAFHSTTPEGFNSRLTFLLQCTRQGPTPGNIEPDNLAFGPQPVCILRIGDFYNTKIMIDNLSIDYEPLVWDLNPEGVGVQPMIANVTISFKYIGGSSMYGPINKLQNALSFNYFANSQVYDPRADYIASIKSIQNDGLIKGYPTDTGLQTRKTFGSSNLANNPQGNDEPAYGLVPGLDSVNDSMGAFENKQPVYDANNSTTSQSTQNNSQTTQVTQTVSRGQTKTLATEPPCIDDSEIIILGDKSGKPMTELKWTPTEGSDSSILLFSFIADDPASMLSQNYIIKAKIINDRDKKEYTATNINSKLLYNSFSAPATFSISNTETNPVFTISPTDNDTYTLSIDLVGDGGSPAGFTATACTINITQPILSTTSVISDDDFLNSIKVIDVTTTDGDKTTGLITYYLNSDKISANSFFHKARIKNDSGTESYELIAKNLGANEGTETRAKYIGGKIPFTQEFSKFTQPFTGLSKTQKYFLEIEMFNDNGISKILNKVNLSENAANTPPTPKITGIYIINAKNTVQNRIITVIACQEGIFKVENGQFNQLITDDEFKAFVEKEITIVLEATPIAAPAYRFEKVVTWDSDGKKRFFSASYLFNSITGVYLGELEDPATDAPVINLPDGQYDISIFYEGKLIEKRGITISDQPFNYYGTCAAFSNTTNNNSNTVAQNNKASDNDLFNSITFDGEPQITVDPIVVVDFDYPIDKSIELKETTNYNCNAYITAGPTYTGDKTTKLIGSFKMKRISDTEISVSDINRASIQLVKNTSLDGKTFGKENYKFSTYYFNFEMNDEIKKYIKEVSYIPNTKIKIEFPNGKTIESNIKVLLSATPPTSTLPYQLPYTLTDSYDVTTFNFGNNCDKLHAFQGTKLPGEATSRTVGDMNNKVKKVLYDLYEAGINPTVTSVTVEVNGPVVTWTANIDKSTDGKAWVGFSSRGSATSLAVANQNFDGNPNTNPPTIGLLQNIKATFPSDASSLELEDVTDFIAKTSTIGSTTCNFWQKFAKYTLPVTKPAH